MNRSVGRVWRHPQLSCEELSGFLASCADRLGESAWYIVTRPDSLGFDRFGKELVPNLVARWPQGRVFSASLEIRWKRLSVGGANDVLALTEDLEFEPAGFQRLGGEWHVTPESGWHNISSWVWFDEETSRTRKDARVSGELPCPADWRGRGFACVYYCTPTGEVQFVRLKGAE